MNFSEAYFIEVKMEQIISATLARIHFGEIMQQAKQAPVLVERNGKTEVVILSFPAYEALSRAIPGQIDEKDAQYFPRPTSLLEEAQKIADETGISLDELLTQALELYVNTQHKEKITQALDLIYASQPSTLDEGVLTSQTTLLSEGKW
jgi:hypothetical protein